MKVKDLERTANVAWSPFDQATIHLAAGTAAQQLDASFNTNASIEIYNLNLTEPGMDMELKGTNPSDHRFHKIVWGSCGSPGEHGIIVGGCDEGIIQIYDANKLLKGENALVCKQNKHSKTVHSLDFNPFQTNLLASGAADSEIFIWDINNPTANYMTPGEKIQPFEDVLSIGWNKQVQHILASTFSTKCVVWDLRKNEPIIKLSDTTSRIRWKMVAWHPEVATQLCLASEEDQAPVIQLWDLRFATSPLRILENHQRGVLSIDWCKQDSDLLVSCGKDNRIICWNPNSDKQPGGEVLSEVSRTNQWNFDIHFCPKNPALIASPCFDGHVSIYSLMGGKTQQIVTCNKIADSFPGMETSTTGFMLQQQQQQQQLASAAPISVDLSKPPKWLKKPVGASFGFGGKLVTFNHDKEAIAKAQQGLQPGQVPPRIVRAVNINQVITENDLIEKSTALEQALEYGNFTEYCKNKADLTNDQHKKYIWHFLKANFEQSPRAEILNLLGYKIEDVNSRLMEVTGLNNQQQQQQQQQQNNTNIDNLTEDFNNLNNLGGGDQDLFNAIAEQAAQQQQQQQQQQQSNTSKKEEVNMLTTPYIIKTGDDSDGLITQAILMGNVEAAVELCLKAKRFADAIIIAMTGGENLLAKTQFKYFQQCEGYVSSLISALVSEDWVSVINNCDVKSWKEALTAVLTHASDEELPILCESMGDRLTNEGNLKDAQLCYICAGSFDKLVTSWSEKAMKTTSTNDLQELVELVTFLQKAVERQGRIVEVSGKLAELLSHYAGLLASQGSLATALNYLGTSSNEEVASLRERLYVSLGHKNVYFNQQNQQSVGQGQGTRSRHQSVHSARNSFTAYSNPFNAPPPVINNQQMNWMNNQQSVNQPPKPFSPAPVPLLPPQQQTGAANIPPPLTQPPRPSSVSSNHGGSGLPKNKYVLDPSVSSNNAYGGGMMNSRNNYGLQNQMLPPSPMNIQAGNFQTNALSNPAPMNPYAPQQQQQHQQVLNSPPAMMNPLLQPSPNPSRLVPSSNNMPMPMSTPIQNQPQLLQSAQPGFNNSPSEIGQSAMNVLPPTAAPGWNDPPVFNKPSKQQVKQDVPAAEPITHPIFGTAPQQQYPGPGIMNNGFMDPNQNINNTYGSAQMPNQAPQMFSAPPQANLLPQQQQQQQFGSGSGGFNFNTNAVNATAPTNFNLNPNPNSNNDFNNPQQPMANVLPEQPAPIQKGPIPEEHKHMKTVFDELCNKCSCATNNPQMKRKLDDVVRKLESLYDLLREHKLSANALASLHQIVQLIQVGDYAGGLNIHTQLVSGPDFSQIASFMPGIKVLLQCALQLQVYIR